MEKRYADVIVKISGDKLDRSFQYRIPEALKDAAEPGAVVEVPFGRGGRLVQGYILGITDVPSVEEEKMKSVERIITDLVGPDSRLVTLALWMRDYYGSTTVQALRTVIPAAQKVKEKQHRTLVLDCRKEEAEEKLALFRKKNQKARARLLAALMEQQELPWEIVTGTLNIAAPVIRTLQEQNLLTVRTESFYRTPQLIRQLKQEELEKEQGQEKGEDNTGGDNTGWDVKDTALRPGTENGRRLILTPVQQYTVKEITDQWKSSVQGRFLIHGVTGSGKTEVYMELIADVLARGKQANLLIPEISLTYQNVIRFYRRFGDRISVLHSRLSQGERYDQYQRARDGDIDIMIGPRSALFTPFENLGLIIIDEEHEPSYRSEQVPRYLAREVAEKRASLEHAALVLGSATPSVDAYYLAEKGVYQLFQLPARATGIELPQVHMVDLRQEIRSGNRSILSGLLTEKLKDRLRKKEQSMLFLNRRGFAGFVMCRACGHVPKCPHCDVSLTLHRNGRLICHYCGREQPPIRVCPECGSELIGGFKAGTQQIEDVVKDRFPEARVLRMDADTTRGKDGHAEILRQFSSGEADILVGTQMIVKGHDFPNVTLMGILAADLSLNVSDYRAAERTFQLIAQASGRAGRGSLPGEVVVQSYAPDHYAVMNAAAADYQAFYEQEMQYRMFAGYPPAGAILGVHLSSPDEQRLDMAASYLGKFASHVSQHAGALVLGPAEESIAKINDVYRRVLYIKHGRTDSLTQIKNKMEQYISINTGFDPVTVQFEMNA